MTSRTEYKDHWYEPSATSVGQARNLWQGEVTLGKRAPDGSDQVFLSGHLVPGHVDSEAKACEAAVTFAREYIDHL